MDVIKGFNSGSSTSATLAFCAVFAGGCLASATRRSRLVVHRRFLTGLTSCCFALGTLNGFAARHLAACCRGLGFDEVPGTRSATDRGLRGLLLWAIGLHGLL